jgi:precorrin-2 dehydrogenase/sirohydrochlorin ferrochelatase
MTAQLDFPVCLRLLGRRVLLVGAGRIGEARAEQLLAAGARLHVISPAPSARIRARAAEGALTLAPRPFRAGDTAGFTLVFVATDDRAVSVQVAKETRAAGVWLNAADEPDLCDFTLPSVGRRGSITVAVSTSGEAPALAARLQRALTAQVPSDAVRLTRVSAWLRERLPRGPRRSRLLRWVAARAHLPSQELR